MPNNNNRINFQVGYNVDQASVNAVKKSLQDLQNIKFKDFNGPKKDLDDIKQKASKVEAALTKAFNVNLNSLNTQAFNAELQKAGLNIDKIYTSFSKAGAQGQVAFSRMASEVLTTNMQLKQTNSLVSQMGETMANTVKWGIASSVMNNFTNSVRQAFDYVKALDSSLNDIRIVTKQSSEQMANFAVQANNSAQALGRSTMDYTKAALTFYQQGLDEASVQARTQSVLKAQNITGAGQEMADYLTAVWNGYKVANEEAELYVDKLAAVADSSASNMSQLAIAMSKVASSANLLGVPVDSLNAQIATIVATTRQAPESVGNALKTIYSRINDIATGADDAQISLGNYSAKMAQVGVNVLDANGRLRDTGDVIDEIGGKWETLSHEQQIYLARTMAGQRQYNNLLALFENWGKYSDLVNVSMEAQGATAQKNAIYMESLSAKMEQLGAAGEKVKAALIDEDDLKGFVEFGTGAVNLFGNLIQSIGGGKNAILTLGSIFTQVFSGTIAKQINNVVTHFQDIKNNAQILKQSIASTQLLGKSQGYQNGAIKEMVDVKKEIASYYSLISAEQMKSYNSIVQQIGANKEQVILLEEKIQLGQKYKQSIEQAAQKSGLDFVSQYGEASIALQKLIEDFNQFNTTKKASENSGSGVDKLYADILKVQETLGSGAIPNLQRMKDLYEDIDLLYENGFKSDNPIIKQSTQQLIELIRQFKQQASDGLQHAFNLDSLQASLDQANAKLQESINRAKQFQAAMQQFGNIKGIVDTASALGRLGAGLNSLANLKNVWSNENLSGGEKFLQTVTNLGMTIPMLTTALKTLKTTTTALSNTYLNQATIQKANIALNEKEAITTKTKDAIEKLSLITGKSKTDIQKAKNIATAAGIDLTGKETTVENIKTVVTKAHTEALKQQKNAQDAVNTAMSANPIGAIITGITLAITAITGLIKIYDHFTMSTKQAEQAIDAFNEKQKQIADSNTTFHEQTSNLESLKKQYEQLAKKAGAANFDATIDNLTQSERERYNQIKNIIVSYNDQALAGYNAQGQAILDNNTKLEKQIQILKQKRQAEIDAYVSSQDFQEAKKGYQTTAESTKRELQFFRQDREEGIFDQHLNSYLDMLEDSLDRAVEYGADIVESSEAIYKVRQGGVENLSETFEELQTALDKISVGSDYSEATLGPIQTQIQSISDLLNLDFQESELQKKASQAAKIPVNIILSQLQSSANNTEYSALVQTYGQAMINSIIRSYIQGFNNGQGLVYSENFNETDAIKQIRQVLLQGLTSLNLSDSDIKKIQNQDTKILESLSSGQIGLEQYKSKRLEAIQEFINQNEQAKRILEQGTQEEKQSLYSYIQTIFGLSDFSTSQVSRSQGGRVVKQVVYDIKDQAIEAGKEAKKEIESYFENNPIDYEGFGPQGVLSATVRDKQAIDNFLNSSDIPIEVLNNWELFLQYLNQIPDKAGRMGQAIQQAIEKVKNAPALQLNLGTLGSLETLSAGNELDDQQFTQLGIQLDNLVEKQLIAKDTADILKREWMQGTDVYKQSLREVSDILLNEFQQALQADPSSLQEVSGKLKDLITNTETLHQAQSMGLLTENDHYDILGRLGSQYDSCSDQLELFTAALASGDQQLINSTADALAYAIQMEQMGEANKVGAESLAELNQMLLKGQISGQQFGKALKEVSDAQMEALGFDVDQYEDWVDILQDLNPQLEQNQYLARQMAKANMRISKGMDDLIANFDQWNDALLDFQENGDVSRLVDSWDQIRQTMANLFDSDVKAIDMLGPDFIAQNMDKIQAVKDGVDGAYEQLAALMSQQLILNAFGVSDFSQLNQDIQDAWSEIEAFNADASIQVGAVCDDSQMLEAFQRIAQGAKWTSEEAQAAFSQMGYDVTFKAKNPEKHTDTQNTQYYVPPTWTTQEVSYDLGPFGSGRLSIPVVATRGHYESVGSGTKETYEPGAYAIETVTKNGKGSGGNITRQKVNSAAPRGSSNKGGGGGSRGSTPKAPTQAKISTSKIDTKIKASTPNPYQQEEKSFDRQSKILDELQNKQKKLVNKDRLKNLEQQNKVLEKQKDILQKELDISANEAAENSTANYANRLKEAFKDISFDQDGQIADINKIQAENADIYNQAAKAAADAFEKEKAEYNNYIQNVWNQYADKDQQDAHKGEKEIWDERIKNAEKAANNSIKKAEQVYKEREDLIKSYNDAWKEDQERLKEYNELTQQIYDNLIDISKIRVDLSIDTGQFERDWLDFRNKVIKKLDKEDFLGNAKANVEEFMSYFDSQQIQQTKNQIASIRKQIDDMRQGALSQVYGTNIKQAEEDLKNYMQQQMKDLQEIQDLSEKIMENYLDALDDAKDKMDDQIDQYERVNDLVEHNMKLTQMLYGDKAYDTMEKYYDYQKDNNQNILNNLRAEQLYWQTLLNQQTRGSDAWKQIKENLDNVTDDLNSKLQDMIDNLANQFENRVNGIIDRLNNALTGGRGLDFLDEQWDYISNYDDNFLDTFETKTGIDEVERLYQSQIDNLAGSPKSQQALNKLMNDQLKFLREKDHLTEYDLERAKASLEVEKARLALEEARDNKTKMRLRRDSQGNYTYQYVADEQKLGDLQAALADAQANLYNTDKQHYKQNLNTLYDTYKDYIEKMRDLTAEYNATQDEEQRKRIQGRIDLLKESTAKIMDGLTEDNSYLLNYLNGSFFGGMGVDTSALTMEEQMEIMKENIPYMQSNIQDLADTIVGEGGILPATADMVKQLNNATTQYDQNVEQILASAGTNLQTISNVTDALGNSLDKNILQVQSLTGYYTDLIDKSVEAINEIQKVLSTTQGKLNELIPQQTIDNLAEAYNLAQLLNGVGTQINGQYLDKDKNTLLTQNKDGVFIDDQLVGWNLNTNMTNQQYQNYLKKMSNTDSLSVSSKVLDTISNLDIGKLQQQDLKTVVSTIQAITSNINSIAGQGIDSIMSNASGYIGNINNVEQLDQNVHIEANFPNVTQHTQIEQALQNLVNMASMRASKYRD